MTDESDRSPRRGGGRGALARDGVFEITDVMEGSYRVMVTRWARGGHLSGSMEVELTAGDLDVEITLKEYSNRR